MEEKTVTVLEGLGIPAGNYQVLEVARETESLVLVHKSMGRSMIVSEDLA